MFSLCAPLSLFEESTSGEAIPPSPYDAAEATAYTTGKTWSVRPQRASGSRSGERFSRSDATRPGEGGDAWAPALNLEGGVRRTTGVDPEDSNECVAGFGAACDHGLPVFACAGLSFIARTERSDTSVVINLELSRLDGLHIESQ